MDGQFFLLNQWNQILHRSGMEQTSRGMDSAQATDRQMRNALTQQLLGKGLGMFMTLTPIVCITKKC